MKIIGRSGPILTCIFFLLSSCSGNLPLLPDAQNQPQVVINTIQAGKVMNPGMRIPLSLDIPTTIRESSQSPDSLIIELLDSSGKLAATISFKEQALLGTSLHPFELPPGLKSGTYTLSYKLYKKDILQQEKSVTFFYTPEALNGINISSYPVSLYPDASCILEADIDVPEGIEPYLVWKSKNKVLYSGKISDGAGKIEWVAPKEEGVYNVRVDVFPFAPEKDMSFPFSSQDYDEIKIFVTRKPAANPDELPDGKEYTSLFHFRGDFRDEGNRKRAESEKVTPKGKPVLRKEEGIFGYFFDGASGLSIPALILPAEKSRLSPFSLEIRLKLETMKNDQENTASLLKPGTIFSSVSGKFSLVIAYGENGEPYLDLASGTTRVRSVLKNPVFLTGEPVSIAVSVVPGAATTQIFWFIDGILNREEILRIPAVEVAETGISTIGTTGNGAGFTGIIDELGIYSRDEHGRPETDSEFFLRAKKEEYGRDLIFAEGFDGLYTPEWIDEQGDIFSENGKLTIPPRASIMLPDLRTTSSFMIEFCLSNQSDIDVGYLELFDPEREATVTAPLDSFEILKNAAGNGFILKLRVKHDEKGLDLLSGDEAYSEKDLPEEIDELGENVQLRLGNSSPDEQNLYIDGIAVINHDRETKIGPLF